MEISIPSGVWAAVAARLPAADKLRAAATCRDALHGISGSSVLPSGPCCDRVERVEFADVAPSERAIARISERVAALCEYVRERGIVEKLFVDEELLGSSYGTLVRELMGTLAAAPPPEGARFQFKMPYRDDDRREVEIDLLGKERDVPNDAFDWDHRAGDVAVYANGCRFRAIVPCVEKFDFHLDIYVSDRAFLPYWRCKDLEFETFVLEEIFSVAPPSMTMDRVCERVRVLLTVHRAIAAASGASSAARAALEYEGDPLAAIIGEKHYDPTNIFAEKRLFAAFAGSEDRAPDGEDETDGPDRRAPAPTAPHRPLLVVDAQSIAPRKRYVTAIADDMITACEYVRRHGILRILAVADPRDGQSYLPAYRALSRVVVDHPILTFYGYVQMEAHIPDGRGGRTWVDMDRCKDVHHSAFDWKAEDGESVYPAHLRFTFAKDYDSDRRCSVELRFYFDGRAMIVARGCGFEGRLEKGGEWTNPGVAPLGRPNEVFKRVRTMMTAHRIVTTVLRSDAARAVLAWVEPQIAIGGDGFHLENRLMAKHAGDADLWRYPVGDWHSCASCGHRRSDNDGGGDDRSEFDEDSGDESD